MYEYKPLRKDLPEIRLVAIEKAESVHAPLRLRIVHVDLNSKPKYFALLYIWDSPGPGFPANWADGSTKTIQIDGQDFRVRLNLVSALERSLRKLAIPTSMRDTDVSTLWCRNPPVLASLVGSLASRNACNSRGLKEAVLICSTGANGIPRSKERTLQTLH
jgi:hypothetical protein